SMAVPGTRLTQPACASSGNLQDTGKSLFVWDCVVGLRGLELPTKRLSAASPELEQRAAYGFLREPPRSWLFLQALYLCSKEIHFPAWRPLATDSAGDANENWSR
ncbi:MAG: hypothetical protein WAK55_31310, partial [Xanthobacteraceae bacterium]